MTEAEEQELILFCNRWDDRGMVWGCAKMDCSGCGLDIAVSPASMRLLEEHPNNRKLCPPCMNKHTRNNPGVRMQQPTEVQREELRKAGLSDWIIDYISKTLDVPVGELDFEDKRFTGHESE